MAFFKVSLRQRSPFLISASFLKQKPAFRSKFISRFSSTVMPPEQIDGSQDLYKYTSGRWIYNEPLQQAERSLVFNVSQLKRVAAEAVGRIAGDVASIKKLAEGGFNRTFEISMHDGYRGIARLPYPMTVPKGLATASEVATIDFVRNHGVPVPKVFAYAATAENPVGSEYIIMEKLGGKELGDVWYSMYDRERLSTINQVVKIEAILFSLKLPANGSIYYKKDLGPQVGSIGLPYHGGNGDFCIGPDVHYKWWYKERSHLPINRQPYQSMVDVLKAGAERELVWTQQHARPRLPYERLYREIYNYEKVSPNDHISNLTDYLRIAEHLALDAGSSLGRPTLRHPDLQPNNIFVSESFDIAGVVDWQHCSVLPLLLQAGPPKYFHNYGDSESEDLRTPKLPANFEMMNADEQGAAKETYRRRFTHFQYMKATAEFNKDHFDACTYQNGVLIQKLFQHSTEPWEGDNITLKADLIQAALQWPVHSRDAQSAFTPCPLSYGEEETKRCLDLHVEQQQCDEDMERSREIVGVNVEGWVPVEMYDTAKKRSEALKLEVLEAAESDFDREQIQKHWPFDDHDQDGQYSE